MPKFILERKMPCFWQPPCGVLQEMGPDIHLVESYVSGDKVFCIYDAPSEEIMREYARLGGFSANCVSKVERMHDLTMG